MIAVFVLLQGSGYGVTSITRPVVTAEILGRTGFGAISGAMAMGFVGGTAMAPLLGAEIWKRGGYDLVLQAVVGIVVAGLIAFTVVVISTRRQAGQYGSPT